MSKLRLTLPGYEIPVDGKTVSFRAPCSCADITCIQIDSIDYDIVDALGRSVAGKSEYWSPNTVVTVTLDVTNQKAYVQGSPVTSLPMASYLAFAGNVNADMIAAAFGKGNEDEVTGVGKALAMYSNYKEEILTFKALPKCNSVADIAKSPDAIAEVLSSHSIKSLMRACSYTAPYAEFWVLNNALPDEYKGNSIVDIIKNVDAMAYMYENYETYENLDVFSSQALVDALMPYATTISGSFSTQYLSISEGYNATTIHDKKCLVLGLYVPSMISSGNKSHYDDYIKVVSRPDDTSLATIHRDQDSATNNRCKGLFASKVVVEKGYHYYSSDTYYTGTCNAIIIPCE